MKFSDKSSPYLLERKKERKKEKKRKEKKRKEKKRKEKKRKEKSMYLLSWAIILRFVNCLCSLKEKSYQNRSSCIILAMICQKYI
jgi:cell division protein FtsL